MNKNIAILVLGTLVTFMGYTNMNTTETARAYEAKLKQQHERIKELEAIESKVAKGLCLPTIAELDMELNNG